MTKIDFTPNPICSYCGENKSLNPDKFHYCEQHRKAIAKWVQKLCEDTEKAHRDAAKSKLFF